MLEPLAPENERDPYPCQSPKTLPGIASLSPDKHPALPHPQLHQTQPCDISPETPYDTAIPLHYGSYEYTRSREYFTPQGAGNKSRRDLKKCVEQRLFAPLGLLVRRSKFSKT